MRSAIINETGHSMSSSHISKPGETLEVGSWSSIVSDEVPLTEDVVLGYMGLFEAHDGSSIVSVLVNTLLKNWLRRIHIFLYFTSFELH